MKKVIYVVALLTLTACGNSSFTAVKTCTITDTQIVCPDGTAINLPVDGQPGLPGAPGQDAVILTEHKVPANSCTKIRDGLYVESIRNSQIFDVYSNDKCKDSLGEYCDNVEPSFGSSGQLGPNQPGGGEICWAGRTMVAGEKVNNDLIIRVVDFN